MIKTYIYIINAINYCMCRWGNRIDVAFTKLIAKILYAPIIVLVAIFWPLKHKTVTLNRLQTNRDEYLQRYESNIYSNRRFSGWFASINSSYDFVLSFPFIALAIKLSGGFTPYCLIFLLLLTLLETIPSYRALFHNHRYLYYSKMFDNESPQWHKKWKRISILFCVGGYIIFILDVFLLAIIILKIESNN